MVIKKILRLLTKSERKKLYLLFVAMFFSAIIEVTGIASVMPFLSILTNPGSIQEYPSLKWLYLTLNFQNPDHFLIFIGTCVLFLMITSTTVIAITLWGIIRFSCMRDYSISKRLFAKYLHRPYLFFLNKNTSDLGKNILSEVAPVVNGVILPILQIIAKGIIILFTFILLAFVNLKVTLVVSIGLGATYVLIYKTVQHKLFFIGKIRFRSNSERYKNIKESFGGIKLIKLRGLEEACTKRYGKSCFQYARHNASREIISQLPRYLIEIIAFGSIMAVIIYQLALKGSLVGIIHLLGLFTFAAYRMMPALQQIFSGIAHIRFNAHALDVLGSDLDTTTYKNVIQRQSEITPLEFRYQLVLKGITFTYPGSGEPIIKNMSLKIKPCSTISFFGATGSGKTTIADTILGLIIPQEGEIWVDEVLITPENIPNWQKNLGYIPQDIYLEDDTVANNIAYGIMNHHVDQNRIEHAATLANIHDFITRKLESGYDTIIGERGIRLSGGERQRIGIARALYHDPKVLIFDEATNALDGTTEQEVFHAIENISREKTLIIITHRHDTIRNCDKIYFIENGEITDEGTYDKLKKTNIKFRRMTQENSN